MDSIIDGLSVACIAYASKTINQRNGGDTMVTKDAWRVEAPALIKTELEKRLPSEFKILRLEPESFYHEGREVRYVNVIYTGADPEAAPRKTSSPARATA